MKAKFPARSLGVFFWMSIWIFILALPSCSLQKFAVDSLGKALAESSSVYATDDDPDLVGAAMPFGLKTIEGLLAQSPHNQGLLLAATSGFTQYAYGFVQTEADFIEDTDIMRAIYLRERALRLYLRALGLRNSRPRGGPALLRRSAEERSCEGAGPIRQKRRCAPLLDRSRVGGRHLIGQNQLRPLSRPAQSRGHYSPRLGT